MKDAKSRLRVSDVTFANQIYLCSVPVAGPEAQCFIELSSFANETSVTFTLKWMVF